MRLDILLKTWLLTHCDMVQRVDMSGVCHEASIEQLITDCVAVMSLWHAIYLAELIVLTGRGTDHPTGTTRSTGLLRCQTQIQHDRVAPRPRQVTERC